MATRIPLRSPSKYGTRSSVPHHSNQTSIASVLSLQSDLTSRKTSMASMIDLASDVLQLLEDIDHIDFTDFDEESLGGNADELTRQNTAKNARSSLFQQDDDSKNSNNYSINIIKKVSEKRDIITSIKDPNMQKLAIMETIEDSISYDDDTPLFNDDAQSDDYDNDDAKSETEMEPIPNEVSPPPPNRTRSKAQTQEHIEYLPPAYHGPSTYTHNMHHHQQNGGGGGAVMMSPNSPYNFPLPPNTDQPESMPLPQSNFNGDNGVNYSAYTNGYGNGCKSYYNPVMSPQSIHSVSPLPQSKTKMVNYHNHTMEIMQQQSQSLGHIHHQNGYQQHQQQHVNNHGNNGNPHDHTMAIMQQQSQSLGYIKHGQHQNNMDIDNDHHNNNTMEIMQQQSQSLQHIGNNNVFNHDHTAFSYNNMAKIMQQQSQTLPYIHDTENDSLKRKKRPPPPRKAPSARKVFPKPPPPKRIHSTGSVLMQTQTSLTGSDAPSLSSQPSDLFIQRPIKQVARLLYDLVDKDMRKYKMHTYTNCFYGRDAITVMEENNLCLHRKHGVELCREMEQLNIIHHVLYEQKRAIFGDNKDSVYQFTIDDQGLYDKNTCAKDLDVAFGLLHEVETEDLLNNYLDFAKKGNQDTHYREMKHHLKQEIKKHVRQNTNGELPRFARLPSVVLQTLDLKDYKKVSRHKSTLTQFKETQDKYVELPELSGWMEKQSATGFKSWQRRWVIVRRTHMLWSKNLIDTRNPLDPKERKKFNNSMTLLTIKQVRPVASKGKRKFDIITASKTYHWKCKTAEQRDLWLNGMQRHLQVLAESMRYLKSDTLLGQH